MILHKIAATIAHHSMLAPGEGVLLAVSGGPDSTALLVAMAALAGELGVRLHAAHFNHGVRGAESDRDQQAAAEAARRYALGFTVGAPATPLSGPNFEARARRERYSFLRHAAAAAGCAKIATGHTLDDQAETVILRMLRGTGVDGLGAIAPVRADGVVRPLIDCTRDELLPLLQGQRVTYARDSSNDDPRYLRNRVRSQLMPALFQLNPNVRQALARVSQSAREDAEFLAQSSSLALASVCNPDGAMRLAEFLGLSRALQSRVLRSWLADRRGGLEGLNSKHVASALRVIRGGRPNARVQLPDGDAIERGYEAVIYCGQDSSPEWPAQRLRAGERLDLPDGWSFESKSCDRRAGDLPADLLSFWADADLLPDVLLLRTAQPGDRIQPLGMSGHRKLHDIFVDRRIPRRQRWNRPLLLADGDVIWVPGVVRSAVAAISPRTQRTLEIVARPPAAGG